ncbi:MAG TPA: allantoate amidohydrolase [Herpetosiphonaceae bacterium]|nr:allantoate amidohydrolase [Herpetosiphonaceae bacterium]
MDLIAAELVMERCALLGAISEEPDRLTRRFATPAMARANDLVGGWMAAAGMAVRRDQIGNLIGRYESDRPGAKTLLLGSHLDTVRDAGRYDGPLGVLVALACVERLAAAGARLPFAIELAAFADEEGLRFQSTYLGSAALAGTFDPASLALADADGISMAAAIRGFGGDPENIAAARSAADLLGYCEVHIEQGPVLERLDLPVGVVEAIAGQTRVSLEIAGMAGHAGTVPMALRQDALCAAAAIVLAVESAARSSEGLVATVGQIQAEPGASNVIPGRASLSLDVRHQDDERRRLACELLREQAGRICAERGVALGWQGRLESRAVPCDPRLTALLAQAVQAAGYPAQRLMSGAGHDGVALSALTAVAMLFVRCRGGISHNPAESVATADVAVAIRVLSHFLALVGEEG